MQLDEKLIKTIAPRARQEYVDAFVNGEETLRKWGFGDPLRFAALFANACAETGGLTLVVESGNYSAKRLQEVFPIRYKPGRIWRGKKIVDSDNDGLSDIAEAHHRKPRHVFNYNYGFRLGNEDDGIHDDDGFKFRGRSLAQTTGKYNYRKLGEALGIDLVSAPDLLLDPKIGLKALCWELSDYHEYCDMGHRGFRAVCNALNRGNPHSRYDPHGWHLRQVYYSKTLDALNISAKVEDDILRIGDRGELVKVIQQRLKDLGYSVGWVDGIYGSRTRAAVLAFQAENKLTVDGIVGPETRSAMNAEDAAPMPLGDRAEETAEDLREKGSRTIEATDKGKTVAKTGIIGGLGLGAFEAADALTGASELLKDVKELQTLTVGFTEILAFFIDKWYLFLVLLAYLLWRWFNDVEEARVDDHKSGDNTNR